MTEDTAYTIANNGNTVITDGSGSADPSRRLTVTISTSRVAPSVHVTDQLGQSVVVTHPTDHIGASEASPSGEGATPTLTLTTLVLDGPRASLNAVLATLELTPTLDMWGFDQMSLTVDDGVDTAATSLLLSIAPLNDAPMWASDMHGVDVDSLELNGYEDTPLPLTLTDFGVSLIDPDVSDIFDGHLVLDVTVWAEDDTPLDLGPLRVEVDPVKGAGLSLMSSEVSPVGDVIARVRGRTLHWGHL